MVGESTTDAVRLADALVDKVTLADSLNEALTENFEYVASSELVIVSSLEGDRETEIVNCWESVTSVALIDSEAEA